MKLDPERVLAIPDTQPGAGAAWRFPLIAIAAAVAAILALYWPTAASMASIWARSDTFAHGYFIAPIAAALVWRERRELAALAPRLDPLGFALLAAAGAAWLVGAAGHAQVVQHYAMTAMIPGAVLALAGRRVAAAIAFPLAFLLLAVPAGEGLLPRLMNFTADFTVAALQLTGIPVYREGNMFSVPSGQWSVVEACSGLRYLIASVTVGTVYAYLTYRRAWKRVLFIALSIAVPIAANGLRAYFIVLIGHLSDMKLAVGVDHFIYGWVFFGLVIGLLFWLGSFWRDAPAAAHPSTFEAQAPASAPVRAIYAALGVLALSAVWPAYAAYLERGISGAAVSVEAPQSVGGWTREAQVAERWRPHYAGAAGSVLATYRNGQRTVHVYLARYRNQRQGAELVSAANSLTGPDHAGWTAIGETTQAEGELEVRETRLRSSAQRLLVWDWYRVAGRELSDPYLAKALLARDRLLGRGDDAAAIVLAAPYAEDPAQARDTLRAFAADMRQGMP